jgi:Fe-S cluster biosynthesis and repair protein YggX
VRLVHCVKLGKDLPGMEYAPFGGPLGDKIWATVSEEAWKTFLDHFKMVMNEYRLQGGTEQATNAFLAEAEKYFYGDGAAAPPPDFKPQH